MTQAEYLDAVWILGRAVARLRGVCRYPGHLVLFEFADLDAMEILARLRDAVSAEYSGKGTSA